VDRDFFVQNVKSLCSERKLTQTEACKASGVGASFISDIKRGQTPSVEKVQMLAAYLGVTTSELLGETPAQPVPDSGTPEWLADFHALSPTAQREVLAFIQFKKSQEG